MIFYCAHFFAYLNFIHYVNVEQNFISTCNVFHVIEMQSSPSFTLLSIFFMKHALCAFQSTFAFLLFLNRFSRFLVMHSKLLVPLNYDPVDTQIISLSQFFLLQFLTLFLSAFGTISLLLVSRLILQCILFFFV